MAEKGGSSAPPQDQSGAMAAPPPSYEASMSHPIAEQSGAAGGFVAPPGTVPHDQYPKQASYIPPQGAAPAPQAQQPVIVQYVNAPTFGPHPVQMTCPHCQSQVRTSTDSEPGPLAWILSGVLCVVGLWVCACIPCCIESLNSVTHKCPQCKNFLGRYKGGM